MLWIVDDSPTEAAITQRSLGPGYDCELFGDGSTAVERLVGAQRLPDLLILDWVMPGMNGGDVCRFVRSRAETRDLPIIIVTASRIDTSDIVAGLEIGANDYVPRPFAPEELRARVDAVLRAKQLADLAQRERQRLTTVNHLSHALFHSTEGADAIVDELARALTATMCDGCAMLLLPGELPTISVARHRHGGEQALAEIASLADPAIHSFTSSEHARATLPPAYTSYIDRFGLRGLAILPLPMGAPIRGVVTVTRERAAEPFDADDIATIETCIEHTSLALERSLRFDAEQVGRTQLDTVLASLPLGIIASDAQGAIQLANHAASALIPDLSNAKTLRELFALPCWAASDGSALPHPDVMFGGAQGELAVSADLQLRISGDDGPRTVAVSSTPLRNSANIGVGSVTVFADVSGERAISAERERVARFQEEMVAIVGHDLRSPLGALFAGVDLLKAQISPESATGSTVRHMESSTNRMMRIIEQLMDMTRARLGAGIPIARSETSLGALAKLVVDELALAYPATRFELRSAGEVRGVWDADRLEQVISNLASNAAQYGRAGEPVTIEVARTDKAAIISVRNEVRDEPISAMTRAVLFEPYRRGGATGHTGGLGLGLYIVGAIVKAHQGAIDVTSTKAGTVFQVTLPLDHRGAR